MPSFTQHRNFRVAILAAYALIVGVDQGLHYFAHPDACHGHHAADGACACGACEAGSAFARHAKAQLAAEQGRLTLRPGDSSSHDCCECVICQSLTQMVGGAIAPPATIECLMALGQEGILSERAPFATLSNTHLARGPPPGVYLS